MITWLAPVLWLSSAHADTAEAEACLRPKVWEGYADGWGVRTMTSTEVADGKTRNYLVTLYSGNDYRIQTCSDAGARNLDVLLYNDKGSVVARDTTVDREPVVSFTPPETGTYYLVVYNRAAAAPKGKAAVALAVVYR